MLGKFALQEFWQSFYCKIQRFGEFWQNVCSPLWPCKSSGKAHAEEVCTARVLAERLRGTFGTAKVLAELLQQDSALRRVLAERLQPIMALQKF